MKHDSTQVVPPALAKRNRKMLKLADAGATYKQLSDLFAISRARAWQIVRRERNGKSK